MDQLSAIELFEKNNKNLEITLITEIIKKKNSKEEAIDLLVLKKQNFNKIFD